MDEITQHQIAIRELQRAAYHEAGHKVLYERFGGIGETFVWKNACGEPEETAWRGQFRSRACPEKMHEMLIGSGVIPPDLPPNWEMLFGVAGLVAEEILSGEVDAGVIADDISLKIFCGLASESDMKSMGITDVDSFLLNYADVEQAVRYLLDDWALVRQEAESLIEIAPIEPPFATI